MNAEARISIERQFKESTKNGLIHQINTNEQLEPGTAVFSKVYEHLRANKKKFMDKNSQLSTSLAFFSVLSAVNNERLWLSAKPNPENDFEIAKLKKLSSS